jgi:thiamine-monophosphate kinase
VSHLGLGAGAEFDRIRAIERALGAQAGELGDDCALVPTGDGFLALSIDLSVEGVHFRREWLSLEEIGWRAAAGALSDLAAEAATPVGILVSLGVPADSTADDSTAVMKGAGAAAAAVGAVVLGGDLSRAPALVVDVAVVGRTARPVRRRGAAPGDGLWVTGDLGGARAALTTWQAGRPPAPAARRAFARPEPRVAAGQWLAGHGAKALIDLSDGLAGDADHLAAASEVAIELELERIPWHGAVPDAAAASNTPPAVFAALGGEDYELLAALPGEFGEADAAGLERELGLPLTRVGRVGRGSGIRCTLQGRELTLRGYDHFA